MKLAHKVIGLLGVSIVGSLAVTTSLELSSLKGRFVAENDSLHRTILANLTENLAGALYNVDQSRVERQLTAAFQFGSIQRVSVFDDSGKFFAAFEAGPRFNDDRSDISSMHKDHPALSGLELELKTPQKKFMPIAIDMVANPEPIDLGKRVLASLWYQDDGNLTFVGHALIDYSEERVVQALEQTKKEKFLSVLALSLVIFSISFLFLRTFIIRRLEKLEVSVKLVEKRDYSTQIEVSGHDEISDLSHSFRSMVDEIRSYQTSLEAKVEEQTGHIRKMLLDLGEKTKAIESILDNVEFGLLRCDSQGRILPGYSRSCNSLLIHETSTVEGQFIWDTLGLKGRDAENFEVLYIQSLEDSLLADDLITQLPRRISNGVKFIALHGAVILDETGRPESVLFSISDITKLVETERENENNQSLLRILRSRSRFIELIRQTLRPEYISPSDQPQQPNPSQILQAKRSLHTWKGDFSVFGLSFFSSLLHQIEERVAESEKIEAELEEFRNEIKQYLNRNSRVLGIHPDDLDRHLMLVDEKDIQSLEESIMNSTDLGHSQAIAQEFIEKARSEEAHNLLDFLLDGAKDQAKRQGKEIVVELTGAHTRIPIAYAEALTSLVHILRNAVDHGIEPPYLRKNKPKFGTIAVDIKEVDKHFEITLADDGQGIDPDNLKRKAMELGWFSSKQWDEMTADEKIQIVFRAGFSTKKDITESSGRGIGLDAVAEAIQGVHGTISVHTVLNEGTRFTIKLPRSFKVTETQFKAA